MTTAFQAFMRELIDYAGLFPPAKLELDAALREYARHRAAPESWMLARFILPAVRLPDLDAHAGDFSRMGEPFRLTLLVGGGDPESAALARVREEARGIRAFLQTYGERVAVEVLETRVPKEICEAASETRVLEYVGEFLSALGDLPLGGVPVFFEAAPGANWRRTDQALVAGIAHAAGGTGARPLERPGTPDRPGPTDRPRTPDRPGPLGFKLRCGGPESRDVPPVDRVAFVLTECLRHGLPLKCTAGLHHPLRHEDRSTAGKNHGFLNLFGAGILAAVRGLPAARVEECLSDENPRHFRFEEAGFAWDGVRATAAEVDRARRGFLLGFGSCSFDEPRDGLRALGILD